MQSCLKYKVLYEFFFTQFDRLERNPIHRRFKVDEDWTAIWPTAKTFNWAYVPLPIRQGAVEASITIILLSTPWYYYQFFFHFDF